MKSIVPSEKNNSNGTLQERLWQTAYQFRANFGPTAAQYSQPVLGLTFLRFTEARFAVARQKLKKAARSSRRGSRLDDPSPAPQLTTKERTEANRIAKQLLARLEALLVLDWRKRQAARARVEETISDMLDVGLPPAYATDSYKRKCSVVFEHFYASYPGSDLNVYS